MSKNDQGKWRPSLTYPSLMREVSKVRQYGIEKYGAPEDWLSTQQIRHYDAALRHIFAHMDGEMLDPESKCLHLAHAITNLMFEIERMERGLKLPVKENI
jgi:hypothetical protein